MSTRTTPWPAGTPCWVDLAVPDIEVALRFYSAVLGWSWGGDSGDDGGGDSGEAYGGYRTAQVRGHAAAGVSPLQSADQPVAWTVYLATDDAEVTAAAVEQHGGTVHVRPEDVGPMGRWALVSDPAGAAFGLWQAGGFIGCEVTNEPGGLAWEDLRSTDPDRARELYRAVFGFETPGLPGAPADYTLFNHPGQPPLGGMGGLMGESAGTPSHWLAYFGVADGGAAVAAAQSEGGSVVASVRETPYGTMAGLRDPAGAVFWVIEQPAEGVAGSQG